MDNYNNDKERVIFLAGFIDGEGHFRVQKSLSGNHERNNGKGYYYNYPLIVIGQKEGEILYWVKEHFGGCVCYRPKYNIYRYTLQGRKAVELSKQLQPYVIVKKEQIKCMFQDTAGNRVLEVIEVSTI